MQRFAIARGTSMQFKKLALTMVAVLSCGLAGARSADATDLHEHFWRGPGDPYAYRPENRGYYPYYNSGYWKPASELRYRPIPYYELPKYYPAWGYTKEWQNRKWHAEHHGRHRPWHW
jgi:hypothetical protein